MPDATAYNRRIVRYEEIHDVADEDFLAFVGSANLRPHCRVLDCGCGYGACTRELLKRHGVSEPIEIDLVDESALQIARAQEELREYENVSLVQFSYHVATFPEEFPKSGKYDLVLAKMVLHEVSRPKQSEFMKSLFRALAPGGVLLLWDVCPPSEPLRAFTEDVIRSKDSLAGFASMAERRNLPTEGEVSDLFKTSGFVFARRLRTIRYILNTRKRLGPELDGDERLLDQWHDHIRNAKKAIAPHLWRPLERELEYTDQGDAITFAIQKGLYRAERPGRTSFNLRPFSTRPLTIATAQDAGPVFREVLEASLMSQSLPACLGRKQGLIRPTVLTAGENGERTICKGGFEYLYNYAVGDTAANEQAQAFFGYMAWVHCGQAPLRDAGLGSSMSDVLNSVFSDCPSAAWASAHLAGDDQVRFTLGTYDTVAGEATVSLPPADAQAASRFFEACAREAASSLLTPLVDNPAVGRLLLADGSSIDAGAAAAAHKLYTEWRDVFEVLPGVGARATVLSPTGPLTTFLGQVQLFVPLAEYLRRSGTPFCYYALPPSPLIVDAQTGGRRRLEQGVLILSSPTELSPGQIHDLLCYVAGLWSGLGAVAAQMSERLTQSQGRNRDLAAGSYKIGHPLKDRLVSVRMYLSTARKNLAFGEPSQSLDLSLKNAGSHLKRAERLGHILDIISRAISSRERDELFLRKAAWHTDKPYGVAAKLAEFELLVNAIEEMDSDYEPIALSPRPASPLPGVIGLWIADGTLRPADLFYDELLSEVLLNASHEGYAGPGGVRVTYGLEVVHAADDERTTTALVFRNACKKTVDVANLKLVSGVWKRWNTTESGAVGGLFFLAMCLEMTGAGHLVVRIDEVDGRDSFSIGLCLRGLTAATGEE